MNRRGVFILWVALLPLLPLRGEEGEKKKEDDSLAIQVPVPVGHKAHGIKLPDHDENGALQMNFEIGTANRLSETEMEISDLRIETFNEEGNRELEIEMPHSLFDLKTRVISSADPVTVRRADVEVTGGNMTFDTRTRQGRFSGPVRVLIYNRDEFEKPNHKEG